MKYGFGQPSALADWPWMYLHQSQWSLDVLWNLTGMLHANEAHSCESQKNMVSSPPQVCPDHFSTKQALYHRAHSKHRNHLCCCAHDLHTYKMLPGPLISTVTGLTIDKQGTKKKGPIIFKSSAAIVDRTEQKAYPPILVRMQHNHCGLRAGLVVNVFPVIVLPLLSFGQCLCVSGPLPGYEKGICINKTM